MLHSLPVNPSGQFDPDNHLIPRILLAIERVKTEYELSELEVCQRIGCAPAYLEYLRRRNNSFVYQRLVSESYLTNIVLRLMDEFEISHRYLLKKQRNAFVEQSQATINHYHNHGIWLHKNNRAHDLKTLLSDPKHAKSLRLDASDSDSLMA